MTTIYTEERIYKTYRLDKQDTQKLLNKMEEFKKQGDLEFYDEQTLMQQACNDLLEEDAISPILLYEDSEGEEITSVEIYKK